MPWLLALALLVLALAASVPVRRQLASRRAAELEEANHFRLSRRAADEDVTLLGEELAGLHVETLGDELDADMRADYQRALDSYEEAKTLVRKAERGADVTAVTRALENGRFAIACVLARRDGEALPVRRPPCFFNPGHGPASTDVAWAPPGGVEREIPVCLRCSERLTAGEQPDFRLVRFGNRWVPWFRAGPAYGAYARGYYTPYVGSGQLPDYLLLGFVAAELVHGPPGVPGGDGGTGDVSGWEGWELGEWADDGPGGASYDWGGGGSGPAGDHGDFGPSDGFGGYDGGGGGD